MGEMPQVDVGPSLVSGLGLLFSCGVLSRVWKGLWSPLFLLVQEAAFRRAVAQVG